MKHFPDRPKVNELPLGAHFRVEAVVAREAAINAGRAVGVVLYMTMSGWLQGSAVYWALAVVMATQLLVAPLISGKFQARNNPGIHSAV